MAEYLIQGDSLTAIADAIRSKTGKQDSLTPSQMAEEITSISAGTSDTSDATATAEDIIEGAIAYTANGRTVGTGRAMKKLIEGRGDACYLFYMQTSLTELSGVNRLEFDDTKNISNLQSMFSYCTSLLSVPLLNTSNVTRMGAMFMACNKLTEIPLYDTAKVTNMTQMMYSCLKLVSIPLFNTSNVTSMESMLYNCTALTTVPALDCRSVTNYNKMFERCAALTECWMRNIKANLTVGSGTSYGHLLTVDSLVHLIGELRDTGVSQTLTIGTANLEKLANTYVKLVEITDEMRAEDDLIDEKLPFELCESTDEGALLITTDYPSLKNWTIA